MDFDGFGAVLAFIFFVIVPLLQQWRERQAKKDETGAMEGEPPAPPPPPRPQPVRHEPVPPAPPVVAGPAHTMRSARAPKPAVIARAARVHRRQSRAARSGLANRADLRQAVVQMTILGPCRALQTDGDR